MSPLEPLDRPAWLPEPVWPWPAGALATPAGRLAVTDVGGGPVLLLVHTGMWSFVWRDLLRRLTPYFRCVTLDAPGNGRSYRPGPAGTTLAASTAATGAGIDRDGRRSIHHYLADALRADALFATIGSALRGVLADRPLLTVFGQYNDPLRLQPRWKALFPAARQEVVPKGNHFPMCDAPDTVARWIRHWHTGQVAQPR